MNYYRTCPHCGAHLDPGEKCDCLTHQVCAEAREVFPERFAGKTDREIVKEIAEVVHKAERAAQGATNTRDGKGGTVDDPVSISIMNETEEKVK